MKGFVLLVSVLGFEKFLEFFIGVYFVKKLFVMVIFVCSL